MWECSSTLEQAKCKTLAACGLEEPCASFPDFCNNCQFPFIYCVSSRLCTLFQRISDSRFTWIDDFEENLTESVGPVLFFVQYLICRHVRTAGRTDELIRVGLGTFGSSRLNILYVSKKKRHYLVFFIALTTLDVLGTDNDKNLTYAVSSIQIYRYPFSIWLLEFLVAFVKVFVC